MGDPTRVEGMARYGIRTDHAVGVTVTELRRLARGLRPDHELAAALWTSGVHEARILASLVDDPDLVTEAQMDAWVSALDSWDVCDAVCGNLFDRTPLALDKAWSGSGASPSSSVGRGSRSWRGPPYIARTSPTGHSRRSCQPSARRRPTTAPT